jgi:hypothetical protein
MADEDPSPDDNQDIDPDNFENFDDVDSDVAQSDIPDDSFDAADADFDTEGCGCDR